MKRTAFIILGIVILVGIAIYQNADGNLVKSVFMQSKELPEETGAEPGLLAPTFSLEGVDGKTYQAGGAQDKAIIVNFWASWCDPCKEEVPILRDLADRYKDDLVIYGVNVTKYDNEKNAHKFIEQYELNFPAMLDLDAAVYDLYKGAVFPTNVLIDKDGVIQDIILGVLPEKELNKKIKKLVAS